MKTQEEFLDCEIELFESLEYQADFDQLSDRRRNDILFKRLLFDYDEELAESLLKFIHSEGKVPDWEGLIRAFPEIKYIRTDDPTPVNVARIVLKEISLE